MLRTLAFFDLFDHPLTLYELYAWLCRTEWRAWSAFRVALEELERMGRVRIENGMVMLADHPELAETRRMRSASIAQKMKRATRAARLLRWAPFVEMVAVCNRLSGGHPHEDSDIDVFIVIRDGRLWCGRLLVTALLHLAGLRRHGDKIANRVCLSFYLTPRAAALDAIKRDDDPYLRYWIAHLLPLFARAAMLRDFWQANQWAHRAFHQTPQPQPLLGGRAPALTILFAWLLGGWIGDALERVSRALQVRHMGMSAARHDSAVVISDTMLKFHENDRREWYATQWATRTNGLGI